MFDDVENDEYSIHIVQGVLESSKSSINDGQRNFATWCILAWLIYGNYSAISNDTDWSSFLCSLKTIFFIQNIVKHCSYVCLCVAGGSLGKPINLSTIIITVTLFTVTGVERHDKLLDSRLDGLAGVSRLA